MRRYEVPVNGVPAEELEPKLRQSMKQVQKNFPPNTGVIVFAFDGDGGFAYVANAKRAECIKALEDWIAYQRKLA